MKLTLKYFSILFIALILFSACEKEDETSFTETDLSLHFHPMVNGEEFSYDEIYTINGQEVQFTTVQFYVSNLALDLANGSSVTFDHGTAEKEDDLFLLVHPGQMLYEAGKVPTGMYNGINFQIGIDTVVNNTIEPSAWPTDHALSADNPNYAYWTWQSGYLFVRLEGTVNGDEFTYHVGLNDMITPTGTIDAPVDFVNEESELMIMYNVGAFLANIDLTDEANRTTHTFNNRPLASQVISNVKNSFTITTGDQTEM